MTSTTQIASAMRLAAKDVDAARKQLCSLRESLGEDEYDRCKRQAMVLIARGKA